MIGVAILGAGIFAREEHLPAVQASRILTLKAVYSRTKASVSALDVPVDAYYETPSSTDRNLDALLKRQDISAVIIALPITAQPAVIRKALIAGKHVLSEKPIAKDVATARELIEWHKNLAERPIWAVGENLRFVDAMAAGAESLHGIGGDVVTFSLEMFTLVDDKDKFFNTEWRKVPDYQGGFLLDGGVHFIAALRLLLSSTGIKDITSLAARTTLLRPELAPVDTVHAVLTTSTGCSGTFCVSFGTEFKSGFQIQVVTTNGCVTVTPTEVTVLYKDRSEKRQKFAFGAGVKQEVEAFGHSIERGNIDARQSAEEALMDLTILEGMLKAGEKGVGMKL